MKKLRHEIRDPIHNFVRLDNTERKIVDSEPFQRLRHIHQLAMSYLVYPDATHKRFEHSLGVMELAGKVFDRITDVNNRHPDFTERFNDKLEKRDYWKRTVKAAALCHDMGHLPFSHATEEKFLPKGHEIMTVKLIEEFIVPILENEDDPLIWKNMAKIAVGPKVWKKYSPNDKPFNEWEEIMSEIITGDAFGVDRMDYLLRDSYHAGVPYGIFDHHRLIDTLKVLPKNYEGKDSQENVSLSLGMESGGLHSAEALLLARYFMYKQVYFHPVRRIYNFHLQEFLKSKYGSEFPIKPSDFVKLTDVEVLTEIRKDLENPHAKVINERKHYRRLKIEGNSQDIKEKGDNIPKQIPEGKYYIDIYDDSERKTKPSFRCKGEIKKSLMDLPNPKC